MEQLKIAKWTTAQLNYIMYFYCIQFFAMVVCLVGMLTDEWYTYEETIELMTVNNAGIDFNQYWKMGISTMEVNTEFCDQMSGNCSPDKDQKLWYEGDGPKNAFEFPESFNGVLETLLKGKLLMDLCVSVSFVVMVGGSCLMWANWSELFRKRPSLNKLRCCSVGACVSQAFSALLALIGVGYFLHACKPLREHLEKNSWVANTEPKITTMGYSSWLTIVSIIMSGTSLTLNILSHQYIMNEVEVEPQIVAERNARVKAYLNDVANTTHTTEALTLDTTNQNAIRNPGWTEAVRVKPTNLPFARNWKEDLTVEDLDVEAPLKPPPGFHPPPPKGQIPGFRAGGPPGQKYQVPSPSDRPRVKGKVVEDLDADGNPAVYHERKRQVTRAPAPQRPNGNRGRADPGAVGCGRDNVKLNINIAK